MDFSIYPVVIYYVNQVRFDTVLAQHVRDEGSAVVKTRVDEGRRVGIIYFSLFKYE